MQLSLKCVFVLPIYNAIIIVKPNENIYNTPNVFSSISTKRTRNAPTAPRLRMIGAWARSDFAPIGATRIKVLRCRATPIVVSWNRLHPAASPRKSYLEETLEKETGVFVAVSDNMKVVPDQIAPWVPGGLMTLGTDGFGRSDTRESLRRFFEVDAESTVIATLYALAQKGKIEKSIVEKAIKDLKVDPEKVFPVLV